MSASRPVEASAYSDLVQARPEKQKVICYIVRAGRLLVFKHVDEPLEVTGLQVPAGSIEPGESPEDAALREASEETGLTGFRVVRKIGETSYDLAPARPEVRIRSGTLSTSNWTARRPSDGSVTRRSRTMARGLTASSASGFR